ncbi:hypothetical protein STEG23_032106, partial [Scotinomys teguina]
IKDVIIWGNISGNNYVDLSKAKVYNYESAIRGPPRYHHPVLSMIFDSKWIRKEFVMMLQNLSSTGKEFGGILGAHSIATTLKYWYHGSPPGEIVSLGIMSKGQFGIPEGIVFSMPVKFENGTWMVLTDLEGISLPPQIISMLADDLIQEKLVALGDILSFHPVQEERTDSIHSSIGQGEEKDQAVSDAPNGARPPGECPGRGNKIGEKENGHNSQPASNTNSLDSLLAAEDFSETLRESLRITSRSNQIKYEETEILLSIAVIRYYDQSHLQKKAFLWNFTVQNVNDLLAAPHSSSFHCESTENVGSILVTRTVLPSVPPSQEIKEMNLSKQGALNRIENSVYRTAFKLRSVQTLCQLDLVDSSLIQQVLLRGRFGEGLDTSLSVRQLLPVLQELFQRTGMGKPAPVHPRAPELTLSLLMAMYDSKGLGILKLRPVAAALVALSGDSPLTKYRAFFQLYAENNRRGNDSRARMTRRVLRAFLTDLQQPSVLMLCLTTARSLRLKPQGNLNLSSLKFFMSDILTQKQNRYRCLKCLNFDICQLCFTSGLHSKSHQKSHTVMEDCVQISAKESTKLLLRSLRNNLPQRRDRTGAMGRQWPLDQLAPRDTASHAQARGGDTEDLGLRTQQLLNLSARTDRPFMNPKVYYRGLCIEYEDAKAPVYVRPSGALEAAATECPRYLFPQANDNPHHQTIVSIKKLWRTRDSIDAVHRERRLLRKQLNRYKQKLQDTYTLQKEQNCRFETKIQELATNQEKLWTKLQQMRQDLQATLRPLHLLSSSQNTASKIDRSLPSDGLRRVGDAAHIKSVTTSGPEWELLPNSTKTDRNHKCQASSGRALPDSEPPEVILQSTRTQSHPQKILKEVRTAPPACQEGLQDNPQIPPAEVSSPAVASSTQKETNHISESRNDLEEQELQRLLSRLLDAFDLDTPSGPQTSVDMELYGRAEQMSSAFSALVDQITLPSVE